MSGASVNFISRGGVAVSGEPQCGILSVRLFRCYCHRCLRRQHQYFFNPVAGGVRWRLDIFRRRHLGRRQA